MRPLSLGWCRWITSRTMSGLSPSPWTCMRARCIPFTFSIYSPLYFMYFFFFGGGYIHFTERWTASSIPTFCSNWPEAFPGCWGGSVQISAALLLLRCSMFCLPEGWEFYGLGYGVPGISACFVSSTTNSSICRPVSDSACRALFSFAWLPFPSPTTRLLIPVNLHAVIKNNNHAAALEYFFFIFWTDKHGPHEYSSMLWTPWHIPGKNQTCLHCNWRDAVV